MMRNISLLALAPLFAACATTTPDIVLDPDVFDEAAFQDDAPLPVELVERIEPLPLPGQLKPLGLSDGDDEATDALKPYERIDRANESAKIEPDLDNYVNAIQIYPYTRGALYQLYAAPEQVTDIALQPGEDLVSVSAGDTVRWVVGDTTSGAGPKAQVHILVKPIAPNLTTNLVITTNKRAYHLEMRSFRETYMAAVSWRYPQEELISRRMQNAQARIAADRVVERDLSVAKLKFRYEVTGDKPHWRPLRAFDDGAKVYIQFPSKIGQGEAPPLFVLGRNGQSQLVNYRVKGSYYIVDRLFAAAELRLGENPQQVVRITRTDLSERKS